MPDGAQRGEARAEVRYLYGDSELVELRFDVLMTLEALARCVRAVGTRYFEIETMLEGSREHDHNGQTIVDDLARFAEAARIGLLASAEESEWAQVHGHAEECVEWIEDAVRDWQKHYHRQCDRDRERVKRQIRDKEQHMRHDVDAFLVAAQFEVVDWSFEAHPGDEGIAGILRWTLAPGIDVAYDLEPPGDGRSWPGRLGELVSGFEVEIGRKKKLLSRALVPDRATLDACPVTALECTCDRADIEVELRGERIRLQLREDAGELEVLVGRVGAPEPPTAAPSDDRPRYEALWAALQTRMRQLGAARRGVGSLQLDGLEVDGAEAVLQLVERIVGVFRPIVTGIVTHSPNDRELSLKREYDSGAREEVWLPREVIAQHLVALPRALQDRLAFPELLPRRALFDESVLIDLGRITVASPDEESSVVAPLPPPPAGGRVDEDEPWVFQAMFMDDTGAIDLTAEAVSDDEDASCVGPGMKPAWSTR